MTIRKRSAILALFIVFALALYGVAKFNSHFLVEYVVEQTLIQKAPEGADPVKIRKKLRELLASEPDWRTRTGMLFEISRELEKVQKLSPQALASLLRTQTPEIL